MNTLEQINYIENNAIGSYIEPDTWKIYNILDAPYLYVTEEGEDQTWDDEPENFIIISGYLSGSMLREMRMEQGEPIELYVRYFQLRLTVSDDEIENLRENEEYLQNYLFDRTIIDIQEGYRSLDWVIQAIDKRKAEKD